MNSLLASRPVLLFLFLFNAAVAVAIGVGGHHILIHGHTLQGSQQVMACARDGDRRAQGPASVSCGAALRVPTRPGLGPDTARLRRWSASPTERSMPNDSQPDCLAAA